MPERRLSWTEFKQAIAEIWKEINRLWRIVEGPPHPGLEKQVSDFLVEYRTLQTVSEKHHKANTTRLNIIIAVLTMLAGYLAIFHH